MFTESQLEICRKYGAQCTPLDLGLRVGVSDDFFSGELPLNGLRHPPEGNMCGWYLWAGKKLSGNPDYFEPMHLSHLADGGSEILRYLALPPGWRFLVGENCEDVWFYAKLLEI
jgi:hypothetical protein